MEQRVYRGSIAPSALAQHLLDTWDRGDTAAQALEADEGIIVQIGQRSGGLFSDEPRAAVTVAIEPIEEGLRVTLGEQQWYSDGGRIVVGGLIGFFPFFFTWPLGGGRSETVDPSLTAQIWESIEDYVARWGAARDRARPLARGAATGETTRLPGSAVTGETTRLPRIHCPSCGTVNLPAAERCRECGTFLGVRDCPQCGISNPATANFCMRCGSSLREQRAAGS
ncbi:MAG: zinc ribbon domain-containing protein [Chloroflexota bacterium]